MNDTETDSFLDVFGGEPFRPRTPQPEKPVDPPEVQFRNAMEKAGIKPPPDIYMDGEIHRFYTSGRKAAKNGWYRVFSDGIPAGRFGCFREGIDEKWVADTGIQESHDDASERKSRLEAQKAEREKEKVRDQEVTAKLSNEIWNAAQDAGDDHPYLEKKRISAHGLRVARDGRLIAPIINEERKIMTLQYIGADGGKYFMKHGEIKGNFWSIGYAPDKVLYFAEGVATAATVHEVTGEPVIVTFSASNIVPVVEVFRRMMGPEMKFVIVADNDSNGVGEKYAEQASALYVADVIKIPFIGDANDYLNDGYDLKALLQPKINNWLVGADEFCQQPDPIKWLVKGILQAGTLHMLYGPAASLKTFQTLDWCMHISSIKQEWKGRRVASGGVVYLAGEGHHGIKSRLAAWKQVHGIPIGDMWLSVSGCDLNTSEGTKKIIDNIKEIDAKPVLIVVDTLNRFMAGDENSAMDAKIFIDACERIMNEFKCAVLLVHHTGTAEMAQGRARGSSAFRGAVGIELSMRPGKTKDEPVIIEQKKAKDSAPIDPISVMFQKIELEGWFDDDGVQVSSGVLIAADMPDIAPKEKTDSKIIGFIKMFGNAWFFTECELGGENPYVSRAGMLRYLVTNQGMALSTAAQQLKPGTPDKLIGSLLVNKIIAPHKDGWITIDPATTSNLLIRKN